MCALRAELPISAMLRVRLPIILSMSCPICNDTMFNVGRHFKAPKKSDNAQWKKVGFLIAHGFLFQKIRPNPNSYESVPYPDTLEEAKEFVVKYKDWAITSAL